MIVATPRQSMLISGLLQGAALLALHEWWLKNGLHPADLLWLTPLYALALVLPFSFNFLRGEFAVRPSISAALLIGILIALTGGWYGWNAPISGMESASQWEGRYWQGGAFVFGLASFTVWFVLLPFVQNFFRSRATPLEYPSLFNFAWRNTLLLANCLAFTAAFWLLLMLWSELFKVIKIDFFHDLFTSRRFAYPATAMAISFAISLEEREAAALTTLRRYLLAFQTRLLPLAAFILLIFVAALPFTGLQPLWKTGMATPLMLWLQLVLIALVNSAWQDGAPAPFSRPTQWLIRIALLLLPVLSALCIWSLSLRVGQHGWTVDRVWAGILTALTTFYAIGYAACALRSGWLPWLGKVNVAVAWMLILSMLAVHTPLLDPQRIAATSQLSRLLSGKIDPAKFDYNYARFELGRAGDELLHALSNEHKHEQAEAIRKQASAALTRTSRYGDQQYPQFTATDVEAKLRVWPKHTKLDQGFLEYLAQRLNKKQWDYSLNTLRNENQVPLLTIDLGDSREVEYVLLACPNVVFTKRAKGWEQIGTLQFSPALSCKEQLQKSLDNGDYATLPQQWHDLRLGNARGRLSLSNNDSALPD